jgi:hypothetical protein
MVLFRDHVFFHRGVFLLARGIFSVVAIEE